MHAFRSGMVWFGPTEGQMVLIFLIEVTGFFGPDVWNYNSKAAFVIFFVAGQALFSVTNIINGICKANSSLQAVLTLIPICTIIGLSVMWQRSAFYVENPVVVLLTVSLQFFLTTVKIIIASVTKV